MTRERKERNNKFEWKQHLAKLAVKRKNHDKRAKETRKKQRQKQH